MDVNFRAPLTESVQSMNDVMIPMAAPKPATRINVLRIMYEIASSLFSALYFDTNFTTTLWTALAGTAIMYNIDNKVFNSEI